MTIQQKLNSAATGPIIGSRKIYSAPQGSPDILVPFREVALHPTANEPPCGSTIPPAPTPTILPRRSTSMPVYQSRVPRGLPRVVLTARPGGVIKPGITDLRPPTGWCRFARRRMRFMSAQDGQMVTQYEFARAGIITEEMIYVAHRENLGGAGCA